MKRVYISARRQDEILADIRAMMVRHNVTSGTIAKLARLARQPMPDGGA